MSEVSTRLKDLGYRALKNQPGSPQVDTSLQELAASFPADYKNFVEEFPYTGVFDREVTFCGIEKSPWATGGIETLDVLYAHSNIETTDLLGLRKQLSGEQLPPHFLAIGQVSGRNMVCLDLRKDSLGQVFVWDRDQDANARSGLHLAARSFTMFIMSLVSHEMTVLTDSPTLVKAEFSEALNSKAAAFLKKQNDN